MAKPRRSWCLNKFLFDSIPKSAVFRAFLTEFSLNSTSIVDDLSFCRSSRGSQKVVRNEQEVRILALRESYRKSAAMRGERKSKIRRFSRVIPIVDDKLSFCRSSQLPESEVVRNRQEVSRNPGSKSAENFFSKESYRKSAAIRGERKLIEIYCK